MFMRTRCARAGAHVQVSCARVYARDRTKILRAEKGVKRLFYSSESVRGRVPNEVRYSEAAPSHSQSNAFID